MRNNIDATFFWGNAFTIRVLIEIFSSVNQTKKQKSRKFMNFLAFVKKGLFFMAIKFEISLVITFMAFYDCVRTCCLDEFVGFKVRFGIALVCNMFD